jgi:hypothetical protein
VKELCSPTFCGTEPFSVEMISTETRNIIIAKDYNGIFDLQKMARRAKRN